MADLQPDGLVQLEHGVTVVSVGVNGRAGEVTLGPTAGTPVRAAEPDALPELLADQGVPGPGAVVLGVAAERAGLRRRLSVPLDDLVTAPGSGGGLRGGDDAPHLRITVPAPEADEGQAVLEVDGVGVVRWHFAVEAAGGGGVDRGDDTQTFRVPLTQLDVGTGDDRGLVAFGVRKALHLVRFPVEWAAGRLATAGVGLWEDRHRGYGLHRASAAYFAGAGDPVAGDWFAEHGGQPTLLLLHGTFSVGRAAFAGLGPATDLMARWSEAYDGRVLVFDHPTLHVDPLDNARQLLSLLPADGQPVFDVVAHSRGGLVARHLAGKAPAEAMGRPAPVVRRLVHVATPNAGTMLASKDRLGELLDVFTNLVSLFTDEGSGAVAAGVLEVVKQVAVGVLGGLPGIAAMDPADEALKALNDTPVAAAAVVHAITSDYDSTNATIAARALDMLVDALFTTANDLVVPTAGVYAAGSYVVDERYDLSGRPPSVAHSGFFGDPEVRGQLDRWLIGD